MKPVEKIGGGFTRALAGEKGLCRSKILRNSSPLLLCDFFIYGCIFLGHLERELDSETARARERLLVSLSLLWGFSSSNDINGPMRSKLGPTSPAQNPLIRPVSVVWTKSLVLLQIESIFTVKCYNANAKIIFLNLLLFFKKV